MKKTKPDTIFIIVQMFWNYLIELFCNLDLKYTIVEFNPMCILLLCWQISQKLYFLSKLNHHVCLWVIWFHSIRFDDGNVVLILNQFIWTMKLMWKYLVHDYLTIFILKIVVYLSLCMCICLYLRKWKIKLFESFALILNAKICFWIISINHAHVLKSWIFGKWNLLHTFGFV